MTSKTHLARTRIRIAPQAYPRVKPLALALLSVAPWSAAPVLAVEGGQIVQGQGDVQINGPTTTINQQSNALILNRANFNIAPNQRVRFMQPAAFALNRVLSSDPSAIFGQLLANGQIFLINPNGITFGAGAQVNVGALVASTLDISDADFCAAQTAVNLLFPARLLAAPCWSATTNRGVELNASTLTTSGAASASGVALINSNGVKSSGATISITGKNADVRALANQTGVSIAATISSKRGRHAPTCHWKLCTAARSYPMD